MEEIPGAQTMRILNDRLVDTLSSALPNFAPSYPVTTSNRARKGQDLAQYIDHTLLKQGASKGDFSLLCGEARHWNVWSVCVPSNRVELVRELLSGADTKICAVVGFPFGYANSDSKALEAQTVVAHGAHEVDMVIPVGLLKDEDWLAVYRDIRGVVEHAGSALVKVILETSELSLEEKILGAYIACYAGAAFLKTSTGFASGGAMLDDIHILRTIAGDSIGVKASGGIRTTQFAKACINAGADRLGASATAAILGHGRSKAGGY